MEVFNSTVSVVTVKTTKDSLQQAIDEEHKAFVTDIKALATDYAAHNLPEKEALSLEPNIETIRATYDKIGNSTALHLSSAVRTSLGALDIFGMRQKGKELKLKANMFNNQLDVLREARQQHVGKKTWKDYERLKLILNVFTVVETLGYIFSFISMGDSPIIGFLWGAVIGAGQTLFIKALVLRMRDGEIANLSKGTKYLIWAGIGIVATGLGLIRYMTVKSDPNNTFGQSALAPIIFILISYFLISGMALYVWHYYPSESEQSRMRRVLSIDSDILQKEAELADCLKQIQECNEQCNLYAQVHTLLIQTAKDLHLRINSHFKYAVGLFKNTNRIARTDNVTPNCFLIPVADLAIPNYDAWDNVEIDPKHIIGNV